MKNKKCPRRPAVAPSGGFAGKAQVQSLEEVPRPLAAKLITLWPPAKTSNQRDRTANHEIICLPFVEDCTLPESCNNHPFCSCLSYNVLPFG